MTRRSFDVESMRHTNPIPAVSRVGPLVVSSVIVGRDPHASTVPESIEAQLANLFHHVGEMLHAELNEPWVEHFPDPASRPARHTQVGGSTAQCDFIAYVDE